MVVGSPKVIAAFQVLLLTLPLSVLWAPAQARLERGFRFRLLAYLQVACDAALYGVAVLLAIAGTGSGRRSAERSRPLRSCSSGAMCSRASVPRSRVRARGFGSLERSPFVSPRPGSSGTLRTSSTRSSSDGLGSASVGYVALATRLADTASFVLRAVYRVSLVALSRVQTDSERLRRGFEEMVLLATIGVGVPLAVMSVLAPPLFPMLFGEEWEPALEVLPFVSFFYLMLGVFTTHLALLHVLGRLLVTSFVALLRFVILGVGALLLVSPLGLVGYGIALVVSTIAWVLTDVAARSSVGFRYGSAMRWVLALTPSLFAPLVDRPWAYVLLAPIVALLLFDGSFGVSSGRTAPSSGPAPNRMSSFPSTLILERVSPSAVETTIRSDHAGGGEPPQAPVGEDHCRCGNNCRGHGSGRSCACVWGRCAIPDTGAGAEPARAHGSDDGSDFRHEPPPLPRGGSRLRRPNAVYGLYGAGRHLSIVVVGRMW